MAVFKDSFKSHDNFLKSGAFLLYCGFSTEAYGLNGNEFENGKGSSDKDIYFSNGGCDACLPGFCGGGKFGCNSSLTHGFGGWGPSY